MHQLSKLYHENRGFFIPFLLYIIAGLVINLTYSQKEIFFFINGLNHPVQDAVMYYYTFLGDGIFAIITVFLLSISKIRHAIVGAVAFASQAAIVQLLKHTVFAGHNGPWKLWGETDKFHLLEGFIPHAHNSMPSGHAATAFAAFLAVAIFFPYRNFKWLFFVFALGVAYSRIYLSQHLFIDTYVGAIIGVICTVLSYLWLNDRLVRAGETRHFLGKPLMKIPR